MCPNVKAPSLVGKTAEMATLWATALPFVRFSVVWASHRKVLASYILALTLQDLYTSLTEPDEEKIRRQIGVYYNSFTKSSNDDTVLFSVPYTGSQGLGTHMTLLQ